MRFCKILSLSILAVAVPSVAQATAPDQQSVARQNFIQADADEDDRLSKSEFRRFIDENAKDNLGRAAMVRRFGAYETAFGRLDENKDGFVTKDEIARYR